MKTEYSLYNDTVMDRFLNPKNAGRVDGENACGEVGAAACGDIMRISLKIEDGKVVDAKWRTFGCGSAIAASDAMCDLIRGKTVEEALAVTNDDVMNTLGGADVWRANYPQKIHCSVLASEAMEAAIEDFKQRKLAS